MAAWTKRIAQARWLHAAVGFVGAEYLRLVMRTSRFVVEPADIFERFAIEQPFILTMWHGQHFLTPFFKRPHLPAKVLISRHRDGEVNAIAAARLGLGIIRGSGDHGPEFHRKGGAPAFRSMLAALAAGDNVALTADVPKIARVAGLGVVKLASASGRPIYPTAIGTSRRIEFRTWDRSAFNLPFSRAAAVVADPIHVPANADDAALESSRQAVETALNEITLRVYSLVDRRGGDADRG